MVFVTWCIDGATFYGKTAEEAVDAMKEASPFTRSETREEYMAGVAERVQRNTGVPVPTTDAETFLKGLAAADVVVVE